MVQRSFWVALFVALMVDSLATIAHRSRRVMGQLTADPM